MPSPAAAGGKASTEYRAHPVLPGPGRDRARGRGLPAPGGLQHARQPAVRRPAIRSGRFFMRVHFGDGARLAGDLRVPARRFRPGGRRVRHGVGAARHRRPAAGADHGVQGRALPERPAVPARGRLAAHRRRRRSSRNHPDLAPLAAALRHRRSSTCRSRPATQGPQRPRGACSTWSSELAASTSWCWPATCRSCPPDLCAQAGRPRHQHPPLVPAQLQGRPAVPPGARARREADRRDRALRDGRPGRGPDHRAGGRPGRPLRTARRTSRPSAATSSAGRSPAPCAGTPSTASCSTAAAPSSSAKPAPGASSMPVLAAGAAGYTILAPASVPQENLRLTAR